MDFEWDPRKNERNIAKHGIDFVDAARVIKRPHFKERSDRGGEKRWLAIGPLAGRIITVVYTMRGAEIYRIISARRARNYEREAYHQKVGGRD